MNKKIREGKWVRVIFLISIDRGYVGNYNFHRDYTKNDSDPIFHTKISIDIGTKVAVGDTGQRSAIGVQISASVGGEES